MLPRSPERTRMSDSLPTLWHIELSHFSEKARWALAYKGVEHRRRAPLPGMHIPVALFLTRGTHKTFPIIQIDGRTIADSTDVIAALEDRFPEPPLYPADPEQRRRALELEDFFDEELGPHVRRLGFHELRKDPERMKALMARTAPGPLTRARRAHRRLRPHLHQPAVRRRRRGGRRAGAGQDRRRPRPPRTGARRQRVPGRRHLHRRRPHRGGPAQPDRPARRGPDPQRRARRQGHGGVPRAAEGPRRLPVGRGDVRPAPQAGEGRGAAPR